VYFLLLEEETGVRPLYGVIVTRNGKREIVRNTDELRAWMLGVVEEIRAARKQVAEIIQENPRPGQCRGCGMWKGCREAWGVREESVI
jgi:hypothetical protein